MIPLLRNKSYQVFRLSLSVLKTVFHNSRQTVPDAPHLECNFKCNHLPFHLTSCSSVHAKKKHRASALFKNSHSTKMSKSSSWSFPTLLHNVIFGSNEQSKSNVPGYDLLPRSIWERLHDSGPGTEINVVMPDSV